MVLAEAGYRRFDFALSEPYTIAYETVSDTTNFILRLQTDTGVVGLGCAAPDEAVTGERPEQVEAAIEDVLLPMLRGEDPLMRKRLMELAETALPAMPSTLAMLDTALADLAARAAGMPLYQYLGGYRHAIHTSITIGILPLEHTLEKAEAFVASGFGILKLKGGNNWEADAEKIRRLRERFPEIALRFDGNQGYDVEQAIRFFKATEGCGIEIFEQPTPVGNGERIGMVTRQTDLPIMADESIKSVEDAYHLVSGEHVDMINIKLVKVGGISRAGRIDAIAQAAGVPSMVGCMDECGLGIAAGLHFALSRPNVHYADLDGHLDLLEDPFFGCVRLENGIMYPTDAPGLGVTDF